MPIRPSRTPDRTSLRIAELKARTPSRSVVMNMKVPAELRDAIARLAQQLGASKTEVTLALLNVGLEQWKKQR